MTGENATTWRDLADQLDPRERDAIEDHEQALAACGRLTPEAADGLLDNARYAIACRLADTTYADVPTPAGVTWAGQWEMNLDSGGWSRSLVWRKFSDDLCIDGTQHCDGSIQCAISLYATDRDVTQLDATAAHALAALLVEAADAMDALP